MITVSDIIDTAYRKIGVVGHGQTATGEQSEAGLGAFNAMLQGWRLDGLDFYSGLSVLDDAPDHAATDTFPLPSAFREGTIYCLAGRLSPEYSMPPQFDENSFKAMMRAALVEIPTSYVDPALTYRNNRVSRRDWP